MVQLAGDGAGTSVAAGLPNIEGTTSNMRIITEANPLGDNKSSGAVVLGNKRDVSVIEKGYYGNSVDIAVDASRSNPIYGASSTVQPPAIKLIPIIRY